MKSKKLAGGNPLISQLAFKIAEYIRSKNLPEDQHLVEQTLADEFHVSRSPIHKALQLLAKGKIVQLRRNHGFFLARPAEDIPKFELSESPFTEDEEYYQIAGDRVRGLLQGYVSETVLRKTYGISRDKLTKILTRMAQEGWAEKWPGHGWNLPHILNSVDALDQSFRLRIILEPAALLEPTYHVDPVLFTELKKEQVELLKTPAVPNTMRQPSK